jgi:hypothetical protein
MNEELDKLLCAKRVLLRSFFNSLTSALTIQKVLTLGPKTKALLKNLMELRQLLYVLHSFDCVTFYSFLTSLLYNENSDNYFRKDIFNRLDRTLNITPDMPILSSFSIFRCSDQATLALITRLQTLAKDRLFTFSRRTLYHPEDHKFFTLEQPKPESAAKRQKTMYDCAKVPKGLAELGKLGHKFKLWWGNFQDKATVGGDNLEVKRAAKLYDIYLNYDANPKVDALISIIRDMEKKFKATDSYQEYQEFSLRRLHQAKTRKKLGPAV